MTKHQKTTAKFWALILGVSILSIMARPASAIEILNYKSSSNSKLKVVTAETVSKVWASKTPACIKNGGSIVGVNKAFNDLGLKYGDCSTTASKRRVHKIRGFEVVQFKLAELPESIIKTVYGIK